MHYLGDYANATKFVPDYTAPGIRYPILASVRWQLFPPTTLFLPLLDRLCLSFVTLRFSLCPRTVKPGIQPRVGFRLLILLSVVLVFWRRARDSNPARVIQAATYSRLIFCVAHLHKPRIFAFFSGS